MSKVKEYVTRVSRVYHFRLTPEAVRIVNRCKERYREELDRDISDSMVVNELITEQAHWLLEDKSQHFGRRS